jgi:hypothetical protein
VENGILGRKKVYFLCSSMNRPLFRFGLTVSLAIIAVSCGAVATLPTEPEEGNLSSRVSEAVWYAENGDHPGLAVASEGSILVLPPGDDSTYVNGAFSLEIPDADSVRLLARVGLGQAGDPPVAFRAYVQDGAQFPMLAEVISPSDGEAGDFIVDLSPFRGRSVLLILAVGTLDATPLRSSALWIDPVVLTP